MVMVPESQSILVVDDDQGVRECTADLIEDAGYVMIGAGNGVEALSILEGGVRPLAMLVDLDMPLMDGAELCRTCASDPRYATIPRVLMSGHPSIPNWVDHCGAVGFLAKPLDWHRLTTVLTRLGLENQDW